MTFHERDELDTAARLLHDLRLRQLVQRIVAALYINVGTHQPNQFLRCRLCGDGKAVLVTELQPEGGKRMAAGAWLNGKRVAAGTLLP